MVVGSARGYGIISPILPEHRGSCIHQVDRHGYEKPFASGATIAHCASVFLRGGKAPTFARKPGGIQIAPIARSDFGALPRHLVRGHAPSGTRFAGGAPSNPRRIASNLLSPVSLQDVP
jgi:hypothetical protein